VRSVTRATDCTVDFRYLKLVEVLIIRSVGSSKGVWCYVIFLQWVKDLFLLVWMESRLMSWGEGIKG
jgi:hypothetical protein